MVKTVKLALAIMLGLAVILTPGFAAFGFCAPAGCVIQKKSCCGKGKSCCSAKPAPDSTQSQSPAAPAPRAPSSQLQPALAPQALAFVAADSASAASAFHLPPALKDSHVSLYQRNCAYLI